MSAARESMPELGNTGREMYENTQAGAWADPELGWPWAKFLDALSYLFDPLADVTRPPDDSGRWTVLASPSRCPDTWLPVLAQWAGVRRRDVMSGDDLREVIGPTAPGLWRGTRAAMIAAVRRFYPRDMAPDHLLYFEERARITGDEAIDAYQLRVFTYDYVEHDHDAVRAALLFAKPAGLTLIYEVRRGQAWFMLNARRESWADVRDGYENWNAVHLDEPIAPMEVAS